MKSFKITQSITDRKDASLGIYFKDVSKLSMITPEKEVELTPMEASLMLLGV